MSIVLGHVEHVARSLIDLARFEFFRNTIFWTEIISMKLKKYINSM